MNERHKDDGEEGGELVTARMSEQVKDRYGTAGGDDVGTR